MIEISILAGGWSAAQFDFDRLPGIVIGVNEGALCPCASHGVTMDRLWTEHRWGRIIKKKHTKFWIRRSAIQNITSPMQDTACLPPMIFDNDPTSTVMSDVSGTLNGTSSGMCALNCAYQILMQSPSAQKTLYLFGFDCNRSPKGEAYWHPPHAWAAKGATTSGKYKAWAAQYDGPARQFAEAGIKVLNMSATSAIKAFRTGPIERIPKA